jgi:hypothetical protein
MKIFIRDSKNNMKPILINESIQTLALKEEIRNKMGITGEIELVFNGVVLEDNDYLFDLDIKEGNTIDYQGHFDAGLK